MRRMSMTEDKDKVKNESEVENKDENLNEEASNHVEDENMSNEKEEVGEVEEVIDLKGLFKNKKEMASTIKKVENENAALKERLARLSAEYENFRKRTQKEKEGIYTDSIVDVVKEILPAIDNLEASLKVEAQDVDSVKKGVAMTLNQFSDAFEKLKISVIDTDMPFDPNFHDAVMHEDNPEYKEKEITQVFLKGYKREDKIIRYSVVKVVN